MPVYDYKCREHGVFSELATMDQSEQPAACPVCRQFSARIIRLPTSLTRLSQSDRQAHERNERAKHEPLSSSLSEPSRSPGHGAHDKRKKGCGCLGNHRNSPMAEGRSVGKRAILTAHGEKVFPSARPWMISH